MIGRLIDGRYRVRSRIARGGMATVYVATDLRLERRVAIKVMHSHLADDTQFRDRFIQEARSAARLAHPNVVNVFDQGQDGESAYLVMEYLRGITLRDLLQEYETLTPEQTMDIVEAVLSGLAAAHKAGIVHRDLKPENVLLADDGRIKIGDFGLARAATANTATGAALLGTIAYLAPELVTRGLADTRSDIYAVGIMMYEMLAGEQPYKGEQPMQIAYQHANDSVPTPSSKNPKVPIELDELVLWATARDPEQRPRDARVMLERLYETQNLLRTSPPTGPIPAAQRTRVLPVVHAATAETQVLGATPATTTDTGAVASGATASLAYESTRRRGRGKWLLALLLMLAAVAAGTGWYFGSGPGALVSIPRSLEDKSVAEARKTLTALGIEVRERTGEATHPTIEEGRVVQTTPAMGTSIVKGSAVTLLLSVGPEQLDLVDFRGMTQEQAEAEIDGTWTLADPVIRQFSGEVPRGSVIDALGTDGETLSDDETYGELQPITLVVSVGTVPDVRGQTVDEAVATLQNAELKAVLVDEEYSAEVEEGRILRMGIPEVVRPGTEIRIVSSAGPAPVTIPEIVGLTREEAESTLSELGLTVSYNPIFTPFPAALVADSDPQAGEVVAAGSTVTLYLELFG
jgi:beta-lactam-binding protein with PASTA domain/tRNA A-37 threonylcarbamoyl transferase component Bud32